MEAGASTGFIVEGGFVASIVKFWTIFSRLDDFKKEIETGLRISRGEGGCLRFNTIESVFIA